MPLHCDGNRVAEHRAIDVVGFQELAGAIDDGNGDCGSVKDGAELRLGQAQRIFGFLARKFGLEARGFAQARRVGARGRGAR